MSRDYTKLPIYVTETGMSETDDVAGKGWQQAKIASELDNFPNATHFTACAVVFGEFEAAFDDFVLTAKPGK